VFRAWQGCLFWVWLCEKDHSAFPMHFHRLTTKPTLCPVCDPPMGPFTKSLFSSRYCPASMGSGFQSRSTHGFNSAANPSSMGLPRQVVGCSLSGVIHGVILLLPPSLGDPYSTFRCDQNEARWPAFVNMYRCSESRELLKFRGCAKSYFIAKCISSG